MFVNAKKDDRDLANWLAGMLENHDMDCNFPFWDCPANVTPEEVLEDIEKNLKSCDTMICVYGAANVAWVRGQFMESKRIRSKGGPYFPVVGVFHAPPPPKDDLGLRWKSIKTINGLADRGETILTDFVTAVLTGRPS